MFKAVVEYAGVKDVFTGTVPNYAALIKEMQAHLVHMPPQFRKQLYLWLKKEF